MSANQEEQLEKLTATTLLRVIDFLRFSEAKNGALVTFASAWILGLIALITSDRTLPEGFKSAVIFSIPLFFVAAFCGLYSFKPKTTLSAFTRLHSVRHDPNLLFFGDISSMEIDDYGRALRERYLPKNGGTVSEDYFANMCIQISVNSKIVMRKLRLFTGGLLCTAGALLILAIPVLRLVMCSARSLIWG